MGQASFLDTSSIRYLVPSLGFKRYFPIPNDSNIMRWIKTKQALSEETKILAINGRSIYIQNIHIAIGKRIWLLNQQYMIKRTKTC